MKNNKKTSFKYYLSLLLLVFIGILLYFPFKRLSETIGLYKDQENLFKMWLLGTGIYIYIYYRHHKSLSLKIQLILWLSVVFWTSSYMIVLWYLGGKGYISIPEKIISQMAHLTVLGVIILIFNEDFLLKFLKRKFL
jgi:hypothetical protein